MRKVIFTYLYFILSGITLAQPAIPKYIKSELDSEGINPVSGVDQDLLFTQTLVCNPFSVMGLNDPDVAVPPNTAIFMDPFVKAEIMSDGFQGKDKEYGDVDHDGLIDILYTKNGNELWYIPNTGSITNPDYQAGNAIQTPFINAYSFRLVDFYNDGILDLLLLEDHGFPQINLYNNIHTQLNGPAAWGLLDDTLFPLRNDHLIEAGDIDGDLDVDVLISGQDPGLMGTAFLEQIQGPAPFFFPSLQLGAGQLLPFAPMIPDLGGSRHTPELFKADCDYDLDLFISDPNWGGGGGRVEYYENTGQGSPFLYFSHVTPDPHGLNDIVLPATELNCNWVIMRIVDFFGDECEEAISYDPCSNTHPDGDIHFYKSVCACEASFAYGSFSQCGTFFFNNTSSGPAPLTYIWNFDDPGSGVDNTSQLQSLWHIFSTCGNFNVCMTVNGPGCSSTYCQNFQIPQIPDNIAPIVSCKSNVVIALDANCVATLQASDIDDGSYDDCRMQSLSLSPNTFIACGNYPVTLTATDWCGNTNICNTTITVVDNMPPRIDCSPDLTVTALLPFCATVVTGLQLLVLSDNCGISKVTHTVTGASSFSGIGNVSGQYFNKGTSTVTYVAYDYCGNSSQCSFQVFVDCICPCSNNLIINPGFANGAVLGVMGSGGQTNNWYKGGSFVPAPAVYNLGACDPVSILLTGGMNTGAYIYQQGIPFLAGHYYKISFNARNSIANPAISNVTLRFVATNSPVSSSFNPNQCTCQNIGSTSSVNFAFWLPGSFSIWRPTRNWDVLSIHAFNGDRPNATPALIDNICIEEVFYFCCSDEQAFIENTDNAINSYVDLETREAVVDIGNLLECNSIDYINWGDGSILDGPIFGSTALRHKYNEVGSYEVEYQVREFDTQDTSQTACLDHIFIDDIIILPDTCFCGDFSSMAIRWDTDFTQEVSCGNDTVLLGCPSGGKGYDFSGIFYCNGTICPNQSEVNWMISGPSGNFLGTSIANPFFGVSILPSYISQPGVYSLFLTGNCGGQSCICTVNFVVDCPDLCPCGLPDIEALANAVNMGFSQATQSSSCKACFSPIAISSCETVEWHLNSITPTPVGSSNGNQPFCYTFPDPGSYTVIMVVNRNKPDGSDCETFTFSRQVTLQCQTLPTCNDPSIRNPNFTEGAIAGALGFGGMITGWKANAGAPIITQGLEGTQDEWSVLLRGNRNYADVLETEEAVCLDNGIGVISFRIGMGPQPTRPTRPCDILRVAFSADSNVKIIAEVPLTNLDSSEWWQVYIPYDVSAWIDLNDCNGNPGTISAHLQISVWNGLDDSQGGPLTFTEIFVDNVCLDNLVFVPNPVLSAPIIIHPNPNDGAFVLELPQPALKETTLQIITMTGKVIWEKLAVTGTSVQHMEASQLLPGIYFLKIVSHGHVMALEKFVKM